MAKRDNIRRALARARVAYRWQSVPVTAGPTWPEQREEDQRAKREATEEWERARARRQWWEDYQRGRAPGGPWLDVADDLLPKPGAHYREQAARGIIDRAFGGGNA